MWLEPGAALASLKPDAPTVYQLLIRVDKPLAFRIASLGRIDLPVGWYVYSGSARRAAAARISRHLRKRKPKRWHIDYLLTRREARVIAIRLWPWESGLECKVNQRLINERDAQAVIPRFGSSDCRSGCRAHLLFLPSPPDGITDS